MDAMTPLDYFDLVKSKRQQNTDEALDTFYDNTMHLLAKYQATGQERAFKKMVFYLENIENERALLRLGIDTYVHHDDVIAYLEAVQDRVIKITELANYERDIPDDIVHTIELTRELFDEFYVVFTDYTGQAERQIASERREKDPILFGVFKNDNNRHIGERMYFLGDWVDEFCDLTFDRFIVESRQLLSRDPKVTFKTPQSLDSLNRELDRIRAEDDYYTVMTDEEVVAEKTAVESRWGRFRDRFRPRR